MGSFGASKVILHILNVLSVMLGLAIAAASIWFFIEVRAFTSLRNSNHYLLDYTVYWPQGIPWLFIVVAAFVLIVSCCGFSSVSKSRRGFIIVYLIFLAIVIVSLIAAAVVALIYADNKSTDDFVKDTTWDVYFQAKTDTEVATAFEVIETKLQCCGAEGPRDYKNWRNEFPTSCCNVHSLRDSSSDKCQFTNKLANERYGCSIVAAQYTRLAIKILSAASVFTAVIEVISFIVAMSLSIRLKKKNARSHVGKHELEMKKVPL